MDDFSLFEPTGRDMLLDYPELRDYPEFQDLKSREIRLCWLIGNRTSNLFKRYPDTMDRIKAAVREVYPRAAHSRKEIREMSKGNLPPKIVAGCERMANFNPGFRFMARMINEASFYQLMEMVVLDDAQKMLIETDLDAKKKHADLLISVNSKMPEFVKRMESGYGITVKKNPNKNEVVIKAKIGDIIDRVDEE